MNEWFTRAKELLEGNVGFWEDRCQSECILLLPAPFQPLFWCIPKNLGICFKWQVFLSCTEDWCFTLQGPGGEEAGGTTVDNDLLQHTLQLHSGSTWLGPLL